MKKHMQFEVPFVTIAKDTIARLAKEPRIRLLPAQTFLDKQGFTWRIRLERTRQQYVVTCSDSKQGLYVKFGKTRGLRRFVNRIKA